MTWLDEYPIGARIKILEGNTWSGNVGTVVEHKLANKTETRTSVVYFHGTPILIVELDRDDAMDGHKAGVYCPDEVKLLEGSSE